MADINTEMLKLFLSFITERENVRIKKDENKEPQPWTVDEIIADWRFCNINRCHDRETVWIFDNIIGKHRNSDSLWLNLVIARFINWRETLGHLGYFETWDAAKFKETILERQKNGLKVYTGAYLIPSGDAGVLRHDFLSDEIFTPLWEARSMVPNEYSCEQWSKFLRQVKGMGDFMRNQVITDLKYTRYLPQHDTNDWTTFCLAGPGTTRGLNRLHGLPLGGKFKPEVANEMLIKVRKVVQRVLRDKTDPASVNIIGHLEDLNNLSNCFCEFDKYVRVKNGEGKPRSRYVRTVL